MIIKILTRKAARPGTSQLVNYILEGKELMESLDSFTYLHNISAFSKKGVSKAFHENMANHLKARKNSYGLFHEVISFNKKDKEHITDELLHDILTTYIKKRGAEKALVFSKVHRDKDNVHLHVMISANNYHSNDRNVLSKKQLHELKIEMEHYQLQKYPQLKHSFAYLKDKKQKLNFGFDITKEPSVSDGEYRVKSRGKTTDIQTIKNLLEDIALSDMSTDTFLKAIDQSPELKIYHYRGKPQGILYRNKKYRFKRLGIDVDLFVRQATLHKSRQRSRDCEFTLER